MFYFLEPNRGFLLGESSLGRRPVRRGATEGGEQRRQMRPLTNLSGHAARSQRERHTPIWENIMARFQKREGRADRHAANWEEIRGDQTRTEYFGRFPRKAVAILFCRGGKNLKYMDVSR